MPRSHHLRQAIDWAGRHGQHDAKSLELVAQRFDLTPLEEEHLFRICGKAASTTTTKSGPVPKVQQND